MAYPILLFGRTTNNVLFLQFFLAKLKNIFRKIRKTTKYKNPTQYHLTSTFTKRKILLIHKNITTLWSLIKQS